MNFILCFLIIKLTYLGVLQKKNAAVNPIIQFRNIFFKYFEISHPFFLDGDIGQMDEHVVEFVDVGVVFHSAEPAEAQPIPSKLQFYKVTFAVNVTQRFHNLFVNELRSTNVLHLYSAICIASEALFVSHLYSAPSQGRLRQCRLGFEHYTL